MFERVSSYQVATRGVLEMTKAQAQLVRTQEQLSTGRRVLTPADDPIASTRILQLNEDISLTDQYLRNIDLARSRMEEEEGVLNSIEETLIHIRTIAVAAGNGARNYNDRQAYAAEVNVRVKELYDMFNYKDATGEYLFSGFAGRTQPFTENPGGGYNYNGDEGRRFLQISSTTMVAVSDSGKDLFVDVEAIHPSFSTFASELNRGQPTGIISQGMVVDQEALNEFFPEDVVITFNNELDVVPPGKNYTVRRKSDGHVIDGLEKIAYDPGTKIQAACMSVRITGGPVAGDKFVIQTSPKQSILTTFEHFQYGLEEYTDNPQYLEAFTALISDTLNNLDFAIENISLVRSDLGARMNTLDSTQNLHEDIKLVSQDIRSELQDIDYAEAVSRLEAQSLVLQASQQSYAKVQRLSLFNYIS